MTDYPHVPAAFINAIREEGTKAEACDWLQKTWNELCALRSGNGGEVRVKALEWVQNTKESVYGENSYTASPIRDLRFVIAALSSDGWAYKGASYGSITEAKAAAQQDFEQRILSALDTKP